MNAAACTELETARAARGLGLIVLRSIWRSVAAVPTNCRNCVAAAVGGCPAKSAGFVTLTRPAAAVAYFYSCGAAAAFLLCASRRAVAFLPRRPLSSADHHRHHKASPARGLFCYPFLSTSAATMRQEQLTS